jgi:outer membrane protein insertion porin family
VLRLNQLDYFDKIEADKAAEIKRNSKEGTVDINLKLKEKGKQSIGLQGGVSGLAGSFIGLTYQTNNFLGLGETLSFSAQFGALTRSFVFSFTEHYLFDRPISTGFSIFSSRYQFDQARQAAIAYGQSVSINPQFIQNYNQDSTGFTFSASYPMRKLSFTRIGLQYGLTRTNITAFNDASKYLFTQVQFRSIAGPSALQGIVSSTITPTISYNTVNNPMNPTGGKSYYYALSFSGGPLGGNVNSVSNVFDWKYFHPVNKRRNVLSFHATGAFITGYSGGEPPPYSRFYMGGESDIRGYDIRSITPVTFIPIATTQQFTYNCNTCLNGAGQPTPRAFNLPVLAYTITFPGGDVQSYGNFEYRIPIVGSFVTAALFFDGGTNGILRTNALRLDPTGLANLTSQFPHAVDSGFLNAHGHLGIAPNTNFRLRGSTGVEFVVQLPIIQAPFRVYYAYNIHRLHSQLLAPQDYIEPSERAYLKSTYPDLWLNQIQPTLDRLQLNPGRINYFEPQRTFRFTVSRTF